MSKTGVELISEERQRQTKIEGWTPEHDDAHDEGQLALAACCYAAPKKIYVNEKRWVQLNSSRGVGDCYSYDYKERRGYYDPWPWDDKWDKREDHDKKKRLVIAGALIAAEIDCLNRREEKKDE